MRIVNFFLNFLANLISMPFVLVAGIIVWALILVAAVLMTVLSPFILPFLPDMFQIFKNKAVQAGRVTKIRDGIRDGLKKSFTKKWDDEAPQHAPAN